MLKSSHKPVEINADKEPPNIAHINYHCKNANNISEVNTNEHILFAPFTNTNGGKKHAPKRSIADESLNNCKLGTVAGVAVVKRPCKYIAVCRFKETDPACKSNNPKIFILCNGFE